MSKSSQNKVNNRKTVEFYDCFYETKNGQPKGYPLSVGLI